MRNRRLLFESLESRTVLSTVMAELAPTMSAQSHQTDVEFVLEVTDEVGQVCSSFTTGQRLYLNILVDDQRADGVGVFAAALDLLFDHNRAVLDGLITFGSLFPNGPSASWQEPGTLDELFAFGGLTVPGSGPIQFARIPFIAVTPGSLSFTTNPADDLPNHDVLVHGWDEPVPTDRVKYGSVVIEIVGSPVDGPVGSTVVALLKPGVPPESEVPEIVSLPDTPPEVPPETPSKILPEVLLEAYGVPIPGTVRADGSIPRWLVWDDVRLERFLGIFGEQSCYATVLADTLPDTWPPASDFPLMMSASSSSESLFSTRDAHSPLGLQQTALVQPIPEIPIGVAPVRAVSGVELAQSVSRPDIDELLANGPYHVGGLMC